MHDMARHDKIVSSVCLLVSIVCASRCEISGAMWMAAE